MNGLIDKIKRLKAASSGTRNGSSRPAELDEKWLGMDVSLETNEYGPFLLRTRKYPLHYKHGKYALQELAEEANALALIAGSAAGKRPAAAQAEVPAEPAESAARLCREQILFLDTETTGLGVGAGNMVFLLGMGYYTADSFVVEQGLIRHPGEEAAMLAYVRRKCSGFACLASYNGKSFDWPVIKNRCVLNRLDQPEEPLHLDFLHASRRLWKRSLDSCRLSRVEANRLMIARLEDVPGEIAPRLYFQFLQEKDPALLYGVLRHNEYDILTLAVLAAHFSALLDGRADLAEMAGDELFYHGLWLDQLGKEKLAYSVFAHLLNRPAEEYREFLLPLAEWYKKKNHYDTAVRLWEACIAFSGRAALASVEPWIELAKYYEHRAKDPVTALRYAEQARQNLLARLSLSRRDRKAADLLESVEQRLRRLRKKNTWQLLEQSLF
jgi:hypothetical protein